MMQRLPGNNRSHSLSLPITNGIVVPLIRLGREDAAVPADEGRIRQGPEERVPRAEPHDDLISDVVHATIDDAEPLTTAEMLGMFSQFLVAGNETTTKLLASGMLLLLRRPEVMDQVRADASLIPGLVEEDLDEDVGCDVLCTA